MDARPRYAVRAVAAALRRRPLFPEDEQRPGVRVRGKDRQAVVSAQAARESAECLLVIAGRDGTTVVLRHGPEFEVLAENTLDDGFDASPALVDNEIFLRGYKYLYAIAQY
jgi:hypothetical protein